MNEAESLCLLAARVSVYLSVCREMQGGKVKV